MSSKTLIYKVISIVSFRKSCSASVYPSVPLLARLFNFMSFITRFINVLCASPPSLPPTRSNLSVLQPLSIHYASSRHIQTMSVWLLWLCLQNICSVNNISLIVGVADHKEECAVFEHGVQAKTTETQVVCFRQM